MVLPLQEINNQLRIGTGQQLLQGQLQLQRTETQQETMITGIIHLHRNRWTVVLFCKFYISMKVYHAIEMLERRKKVNLISNNYMKITNFY